MDKRVTVRGRRLVFGAAAVLSFGLGGSLLRAQEASEQNLTVWIVRPATPGELAAIQAQKDIDSIKQYRESTAGSFGMSASDVGQTAGSYGHPASEEGRPASQVGQTAGSYGQTASSLPSNVSSQTAGSYGQTAGSFGTAASDYTGAPKPVNPADASDSRDSKGARWTGYLNEFRNHVSMQARVLEVRDIDLRSRLTAAQGKETFPDVLIADRMPDWWPPVQFRVSMWRLADAPNLIAFPGESMSAARTEVANPYANAFGLVQAPHPEATREFLEWWFARSRFSPSAGNQPEKPSTLEVLAREAVLTLLNGGSVESMGDPAMARFDASLTHRVLLGGPEGQPPADLRVNAAVSFARSNGRFAVIQLHAVCLSRSVYGEFFPLVLMRTNSRGEWRVLQITVGMSERDSRIARDMLEPYAVVSKDVVAVDKPVLASPLEGDQRQSHAGLRLAWDATAEDGLMLVEWQLGKDPNAIVSSVMFVNNREGRAHTEVPAPFADFGGPVRWRVWALGSGGMLQMSDWRTVLMR